MDIGAVEGTVVVVVWKRFGRWTEGATEGYVRRVVEGVRLRFGREPKAASWENGRRGGDRERDLVTHGLSWRKILLIVWSVFIFAPFAKKSANVC